MVLYWILVALGFVLLLWYIHEKCKAYTPKAVILKSLVSALFMMVGILVAYRIPPAIPVRPLAFFIVAGCVFGLLGDIFLDLKFVHRSAETIYTYAGFCVFFTMHAIIMVGLIKYFGVVVNFWWTAIPILAGILIGIVNVLIGPAMKLDYTGYKEITMAYGGILIGATALCLSYCIATGFKNPFMIIMLIGYILFTASDLILSQTYFAGKEGKFFLAANYATYYSAMFIFASASLHLV